MRAFYNRKHNAITKTLVNLLFGVLTRSFLYKQRK